MATFKFTKNNGVASVGTVKNIPESLAKVYQRIGIGHIIKEEPKKETKKAKPKTK